MKAVFCTPFLNRPTDPYIASLEASVPAIEAAGWEHGLGVEVGNPYVSAARSVLLRRALDAKADVIVFLDYDLSWNPPDLLKLLETPGDVVGGTYRFKKDGPDEYMAAIYTDDAGRPVLRADGCMKADRLPAGFLKVTKEAVERFMEVYPDLVYGPRYNPSVDLFNHGAHKGVWWGEDYAFSRNWRNAGGELWLVPDLDIAHHSGERAYPGNFHKFMMAQPQPIVISVQPKG